MPSVEFWISIGSTYSYLTVSRLPALEAKTGISFDWKPFSVREIMVEMDNIPFATKPVKARYMWRDIARRAAMYGLKPQLPAPYPLQNFDLANRIAILAAGEGWCRDYIIATYQNWFDRGLEAGGAANLEATLRGLGKEPADIIERATAPKISDAYQKATAEARAKGVFGAPSFVVGAELFWGDDRLEDAIHWAQTGTQ